MEDTGNRENKKASVCIRRLRRWQEGIADGSRR